MADDQQYIEDRVMRMIITENASKPKIYHCAYCHSTWHEGKNGRCVSCGSGEKVCNSCHNTNMRTRTRSSGPR
jgi:hypothetical protein